MHASAGRGEEAARPDAKSSGASEARAARVPSRRLYSARSPFNRRISRRPHIDRRLGSHGGRPEPLRGGRGRDHHVAPVHGSAYTAGPRSPRVRVRLTAPWRPRNAILRVPIPAERGPRSLQRRPPRRDRSQVGMRVRLLAVPAQRTRLRRELGQRDQHRELGRVSPRLLRARIGLRAAGRSGAAARAGARPDRSRPAPLVPGHPLARAGASGHRERWPRARPRRDPRGSPAAAGPGPRPRLTGASGIRAHDRAGAPGVRRDRGGHGRPRGELLRPAPDERRGRIPTPRCCPTRSTRSSRASPSTVSGS